jgi:hypothetical protein
MGGKTTAQVRVLCRTLWRVTVSGALLGQEELTSPVSRSKISALSLLRDVARSCFCRVQCRLMPVRLAWSSQGCEYFTENCRPQFDRDACWAGFGDAVAWTTKPGPRPTNGAYSFNNPSLIALFTACAEVTQSSLYREDFK